MVNTINFLKLPFSVRDKHEAYLFFKNTVDLDLWTIYAVNPPTCQIVKNYEEAEKFFDCKTEVERKKL